MDGFFNLLILLVIAGISVVSFFVKRKEQNQKSASEPHTTFDWGEDDESEGYGDSHRNYEEPAYKSLSEIREAESISANRAYQASPPVFRSASGISSITSGDKNKQKYALGVQKISSEDAVLMDDSIDNYDLSEIVNDFDLPSAVIYSEILRPKYKEDIVS